MTPQQKKLIEEINSHFPPNKLNWQLSLAKDCYRCMLDPNYKSLEWDDSISIAENGFIYKSINYTTASIAIQNAVRILKERLVFKTFK